MFRIASLTISVIAVIACIILVVGYTSSPIYSDSISSNFDYRPEFMWQEITNVRDMERRKSDVESVEVLEQYGRFTAWKENLHNGGYRIYRTNEYILNKKWTIELVESTYGLTGTWTFELSIDGSQTKVTISEESQLTDFKRRGLRTIFGRNRDLLIWMKYIRVGITETLLRTP